MGRSVILQLQGDSLRWEAGHDDLKELILMQERAPTPGPLPWSFPLCEDSCWPQDRAAFPALLPSPKGGTTRARPSLPAASVPPPHPMQLSPHRTSATSPAWSLLCQELERHSHRQDLCSPSRKTVLDLPVDCLPYQTCRELPVHHFISSSQ